MLLPLEVWQAFLVFAFGLGVIAGLLSGGDW